MRNFQAVSRGRKLLPGLHPDDEGRAIKALVTLGWMEFPFKWRAHRALLAGYLRAPAGT